MKVRAGRTVSALLLFCLAAGCQAEDSDTPEATRDSADEAEASSPWLEGPPLPQPITNNAVAAVEIDGRVSVFSFLGLDSTRVWSGVTNAAYRWDVGDSAWRSIAPVPGPGRLASTAHVVDGLIYVIGGYTVARTGAEKSLPDVNVYDPVAERWTRGADMPVPTDDAVAGVWRGDRIVVVSGWHDTGNVRDVQIYEPATDRWTSTTPIPGAPVFGHTGSVVGDRVVYVDGAAVVDARPRFVVDTASWMGALGPGESTTVTWSAVARHPGPPLYRAAAGTAGNLALFIGGTDNPYNYNGIGYDRSPAAPLHQVLAFDPAEGRWSHLTPPPIATMDHRNAPTAGGSIFLVGGMTAGQRVSARVWYADVSGLLARDR